MSDSCRHAACPVAARWIFGYFYDQNANVSHIADHGRGGHYSRWMSYDGLDRLTAAGSGSFGGDHWHRFTYDTLDNLKSWELAGVKDYADYVYDAQHRLTNIRNTAGASVVGLSYDVQGNLQNKNGQWYEFDYGNRLRGVSAKEYYRYDGHGRRVLNWRYPTASTPNGTVSLSQYSQSGQLMYVDDNQESKSSAHIYLAGSLIATHEYSQPSWSTQTKYQHTDALGSPVAVTNQAGTVIERHDYEPYGAIIGKPNYNGIGYTGHMMDGATGLTYMQQRYYDQTVGRFLSVDPVTADASKGENFNRYKYAANNPYRFVDPDGRLDRERKDQEKIDRRSLSAHSSNRSGIGAVTSARSSTQANTARLQNNSRPMAASTNAIDAPSDSNAIPRRNGYFSNVVDSYVKCADETEKLSPVNTVLDNEGVKIGVSGLGVAALAGNATAEAVGSRLGVVTLMFEVSTQLSCGAVGVLAPIQHLQGEDAPLSFMSGHR